MSLLLFLAAIVLISCSETPPPPTEDAKVTARKYNSLGNEYMSRGDYIGAIDLYNRASLIDPRPEYYYNVGVASQRAALYDKAIEEYQKVLKIKPSFLEAYYNIALCYEKKGELETAGDYYQKYRQMMEEKNNR